MNALLYPKTFLRSAFVAFSLASALITAESRAATFQFIFQGGTQNGHQFDMIDSHGKVVSLGLVTPNAILYEYQSGTTGQISWIPSGAIPSSTASGWNATGAWRVENTKLSGVLNEQLLTLTADTLFYLYDNDSNQYSRGLSFNDGYHAIGGVITMQDGWPMLPVETLGGGLKVFGKAQFLGKARFNAPVRIAPAGDLSMGEFTSDPPF